MYTLYKFSCFLYNVNTIYFCFWNRLRNGGSVKRVCDVQNNRIRHIVSGLISRFFYAERLPFW